MTSKAPVDSITTSIDSIYNRIFFWVVMVLVLTMPFKSNLNAGIQILLLVVFLFKPGVRHTFALSFRDVSLLSFTVFYAFHLLSFFNSDNVQLFTKDLILKSSIFFIPIIMATAKWSGSQRSLLMGAFILSISLTCLFSFGKTYLEIFSGNYLSWNNLQHNNWEHFWYMVPISINFHPPYFSLYLVAALIFICDFYPRLGSNRNKALMILLGAFLLLFLALLSSRTAIFAFALIFILWVGAWVFRAIGFKMVLLFAIASLLFLSLGLYFSPFLKSKMESNTGFSSRYYMWQAGWNIIKSNPVLGVGIGDIKPVLYNEYKRIGFEEGVKEKFNTHNQFVQTGIGLGFLGILSLISCLVIPMIVGIKNNNPALVFFILAFGICCITEALLSRQHGVILFSVFCGLLLPVQKARVFY